MHYNSEGSWNRGWIFVGTDIRACASLRCETYRTDRSRSGSGPMQCGRLDGQSNVVLQKLPCTSNRSHVVSNATVLTRGCSSTHRQRRISHFGRDTIVSLTESKRSGMVGLPGDPETFLVFASSLPTPLCLLALLSRLLLPEPHMPSSSQSCFIQSLNLLLLPPIT